MKNRKRTAIAVLAASTLLFSACASDPDNGGDPTTGGTGATTGETAPPATTGDPSAPTDGTPTGDPTETPTGGEDEPPVGETGKQPLGITETADGDIAFSAGEVEWSGYNGILSNTYSTYNSVINGRMTSGFYYMGTDGTIYPDKNFGSYEVVSGLESEDEPLVIKYTISDEAKWSDGTPIDYTDFLMEWVTQNPEWLVPGFASGENPDAKPVFDHVSTSFAQYVPDGPEGELGSKTFTVKYAEHYPDWELIVGGVLPSHVVAKQIGMTKEQFGQAILDKDKAAMQKAAEFWNKGWLSNPGELPDPAIAPSSGPYQLMANGWTAGQSLTLEANPNWWGEPPATKRLTFRFLAADGHPQALQNGELNVIEPQANTDTLEQLNGMGDAVKTETGSNLTWEHLDFNFGNGIFSDKEGGLAAREAFALCVPRQNIVDTLVKPSNPDAVVMNAREIFPFQEGYDEIVKAAYDGRYDQVNIEEAKKKFAESGLKQGATVRIGYSAPNPRRANTVAAIQASCAEVGFDVKDGGNKDFFVKVQPAGDYEVALFAWAGSGQKASGQNIYASGKPQNYGKYSNKKVDEAWKILAGSLDPEVHKEQVKVIEKELWDTLFGIPMYAHPGLIAYSSDLQNVRKTSTQDGVTWNAEQWARSAA